LRAEQAAKVKRESEDQKTGATPNKDLSHKLCQNRRFRKNRSQPILTKDRGNLKIDKRTNYMIVYDTAETIEVIGRIVKELDSETPQVMIEGKVVELTEGNEKDLGLQNGLGINYGFSGMANPTGLLGAPGTAVSGTGSFGLNTVSGSSGLLSVLITNVSRLINLDFKLNLMEKQDKAKIITSPKVITKHKEKANLVSATTQYVATPNASSTGLITNTLTPISANVSLDVTPQVTNENSINLEINIEKSDFTNQVGQQTSTQSNKIQTNVLVDNGNTLMIGGLYKTNESESQSGVPILKDIPLIGWLFKTSYKPIKKKSELIIFITPTIMNSKGNTSRALSSESL
jgi:type IV pilus assembly protein PilQ